MLSNLRKLFCQNWKVQEKDLDLLVYILKTCDSGQYAPGENLNEENLITNVRKLLSRIDKNA